MHTYDVTTFFCANYIISIIIAKDLQEKCVWLLNFMYRCSI